MVQSRKCIKAYAIPSKTPDKYTMQYENCAPWFSQHEIKMPKQFGSWWQVNQADLQGDEAKLTDPKKIQVALCEKINRNSKKCAPNSNLFNQSTTPSYMRQGVQTPCIWCVGGNGGCWAAAATQAYGAFQNQRATIGEGVKPGKKWDELKTHGQNMLSKKCKPPIFDPHGYPTVADGGKDKTAKLLVSTQQKVTVLSKAGIVQKATTVQTSEGYVAYKAGEDITAELVSHWFTEALKKAEVPLVGVWTCTAVECDKTPFHFMVVAGKTTDGKFLVNDPWAPGHPQTLKNTAGKGWNKVVGTMQVIVSLVDDQPGYQKAPNNMVGMTLEAGESNEFMYARQGTTTVYLNSIDWVHKG